MNLSACGVLVLLFSLLGAHEPSGVSESAVADNLCKCTVKEGLTDAGGAAAGGWSPPGCVLCLSVFVEVLKPTPGQCLGDSNCPPGQPKDCKGDLKVTVTTSSERCCSTAAPGGWTPSWGSGALVWGAGATTTFDSVTAKCNSGTPREFSITIHDSSNPVTLARKVWLNCGMCGSLR